MVLVIPKYPVSFLRLFMKMGGWIVLITGLLLLVFSLISHSNQKTAQRFEDEGRLAVAVIRAKERDVRIDADGDRRVKYWLTLEYVTHKGQEISLRRTVGSSIFRTAEEGGELSLHYLESQPDKTQLTKGSYQTAARVTQGVALLAGLIWLVALWIIGGWAVSAVRARRFGTREKAVVQEIMRTNVRVNKQPRYRLVWADAGGREGTSLLRKQSGFNSLQSGDHIIIYQGVKRSWWIGDVGERAEFAQ